MGLDQQVNYSNHHVPQRDRSSLSLTRFGLGLIAPARRPDFVFHILVFLSLMRFLVITSHVSNASFRLHQKAVSTLTISGYAKIVKFRTIGFGSCQRTRCRLSTPKDRFRVDRFPWDDPPSLSQNGALL